MSKNNLNSGLKKLLSTNDLKLMNKVLNSNFRKAGYRVVEKINFAHSSMLEELTKVPLNYNYGLWLAHYKTCEYSLSRELIYFMKVIYLKNYENIISKELI